MNVSQPPLLAHVELLRFCMVGGVGFVVDATVTLALNQGLLLSVWAARLFAFLVAASATWALNRRFTFRAATGCSTWLPYLVSTALGAGINLAIYLAWLHAVAHTTWNVFLGVAFGSAVALVFNFSVSKWLVFGARR